MGNECLSFNVSPDPVVSLTVHSLDPKNSTYHVLIVHIRSRKEYGMTFFHVSF